MGEREAQEDRKGKSRGTGDVKISSTVCDREIETAREGEIVLKAETWKRECSEREKEREKKRWQ